MQKHLNYALILVIRDQKYSKVNSGSMTRDIGYNPTILHSGMQDC